MGPSQTGSTGEVAGAAFLRAHAAGTWEFSGDFRDFSGENHSEIVFFGEISDSPDSQNSSVEVLFFRYFRSRK